MTPSSDSSIRRRDPAPQPTLGEIKVTGIAKTRFGRGWLRASLFLFVVGCGATTQVATSAETGTVRQTFACQLKDGADMDEVMAARDVYVEVMNSIEGASAVPAFTWTPFKGNFEYDVIWFDQFENLNHWGATTDALAAAPEASRIDAAFAPIVECESALSLRQTIYEGGEPMEGGGPFGVISSSACRVNEGKNINDVQAVLAQLKATLDGTGLHKSFMGYMGTPLTGTGEIDIYFYGVHPNVSTYAARATALRTSAEGQAFGAQFASVLSCQNSLWYGQQVVNPNE